MASLIGAMLLLANGVTCATAATPDCVNDPRGADMAKRWEDRVPLTGLSAQLSMDEAFCLRESFVRMLAPRLGPVVGFKAALTSPLMQQRFGLSEPVLGVLLRGMLALESAMPVYTDYGTRPIAEADLLVEVGSEAINDARTGADAARYLSAVYPFIELADLVVGEGQPITGPVIVAMNAGARAGIYGRSIPFGADMAGALASMRVVTTDESGKVLAEVAGSAILGDPLNAVLWIVTHLRASGMRLKRGDLLSLGAYSAPITPRVGGRIIVRYVGLPGDPQISVRFRDR
jgi:2-keto-4-pentenoate hydratase